MEESRPPPAPSEPRGEPALQPGGSPASLGEPFRLLPRRGVGEVRVPAAEEIAGWPTESLPSAPEGNCSLRGSWE